MSDLERRPRPRTTRRQRESRAYTLTLATAGLGVVGVVGLILSFFTGIGAGVPILLIVLAAVSGYFLRRTLGA